MTIAPARLISSTRSIGVIVDGAAPYGAGLDIARRIAEARNAQCRVMALESVWTPKGAMADRPFVRALPAPAPSGAEGADIERIKLNQDELARGAARLAQGFDLVVFDQPQKLHTSRADAQIAAGLIAGAGRPCLMLPRTLGQAWRPERILLAWDGRAAASRAAFYGLEFLRAAAHVQVLGIDHINAMGRLVGERIALDPVRAWLTRHDIQSETLVLQSHAEPAFVINGALRDHRIDLVIMGGYGRIGGEDLLLGPTTAAMLAETQTPVLFG